MTRLCECWFFRWVGMLLLVKQVLYEVPDSNHSDVLLFSSAEVCTVPTTHTHTHTNPDIRSPSARARASLWIEIPYYVLSRNHC